MSIETILTLAVAAGLLILAALVRLAAIGVYRLVRRLSGRYGAAEASRARLDEALPGPGFQQRVGGILDSAGALLIYFVASVTRALQIGYEGLRVAVRTVWYLTVAAYAWVAPRVEASYRSVRGAIGAAYLALHGKEWWPSLTENLPLMRARRAPAEVSVLTSDAVTQQTARARSNLGRHAGAA